MGETLSTTLKLILIVINLHLIFNYCSEDEMTTKEFFEKLRKNVFKGKSSRLIGIECLNQKLNETCYSIYDEIVLNNRGNYLVLRFLYENVEPSSEIEATSILKTPALLNENTLDTMLWDVDEGMDEHMPNSICFQHIIRFGSFDLSNIQGHIVQIGVASGGLMTFLNRHFPNLKTTGVDINPLSNVLPYKYFGYRDTKNNKILIADGAKVISSMADRNETVDGILIDACRDETKQKLACPSQVFLSDRFLKNAAKVIDSKGIISVNIVGEASYYIFKLLKQKFEKYFSNCIIEPNTLTLNWSIVCKKNGLKEINSKISSKFFKNIGVRPIMREYFENRFK